MAARINKRLNEEWKQRIRIGVIMDRLDKCATGQVEMTTQQLKAADILLKKVVPDLARQELVGDGGGAIQFTTNEADLAVVSRYEQSVLAATTKH